MENNSLTREKTPFLDKFYMLLLVLLPVLAQYQIGPLDMDTVLMLVFFVICLFRAPTIIVNSLGKIVALIIVYILLVTGVNLLAGTLYSFRKDIVLRMGRYCLYLFVVFFMGNKHARYEELMKIYRVVAYAASVYIVLQTILFYGARIYLPNRLDGTVYFNVSSEMYRFRAFYSEPADMGYGLCPFVACSLFGKSYKKDPTKGTYLDALFITGAIILSTSGQGIFCVALIWAFWLLNRMFQKGVTTQDILLLIGVAVTVTVLYRIGFLEYAIGRVDNSEGGAIDARVSGYVTLQILTPLQKVFGSGFGNYIIENTFGLDIYYNAANYSSIAEFLFTMGIVGTLIWALLFVYLFHRNTTCSKILILALLFLAVLGCPMTGKHFPLWLTLICLQLPEGVYLPTNTPIE